MKVNKLLAIFVVLLGFMVFSKQGFAYTQMVLDPVRSGDTYVTGIAATGSDILIEINGYHLKESKVKNSEFKVKVPKLYSGNRLIIYNSIKGELIQTKELTVKSGESEKPVATPENYIRPNTISKYLHGIATSDNKVYAFSGNNLIGSTIADENGEYLIRISPQKYKTVIRIFQVNEYNEKSKSIYTTVAKYIPKKTKYKSISRYSVSQKQKINKEFLIWAGERAKIGKMAVSDLWFTHGAAGRGDWYADSPHGEIQIQDLGNPGYAGFNIHAVGGVVFYTPVNKKYGVSGDPYKSFTYLGYGKIAKNNTYIHKYLLADNGIVYELMKKKEQVSFTTGGSEYDDNGRRGSYIPNAKFLVSKDTAAQTKYKQILAKYK